MQLKDLDSFTRAYLECALWSSTDESTPEGGEPLDKNYGPEDVAPETLQAMADDCRDFREAHGALLEEAEGILPERDDSYMGHDFWLSRNGHGTGFFDRGNEPVWWELQRAAKVYGTVDLYVGDDGKIYQN